VEVVGPADHAVVVEEDVDVERPWRIAEGLGRARAACAPEPALDVLHALEEGGGLEGGLDDDHAVEEPGVLVQPALPRLPFPGLRPVQGGGVEELDLGQAPEADHRLAQKRDAITHVGAHREEDLRHWRSRPRVSSN